MMHPNFEKSEGNQILKILLAEEIDSAKIAVRYVEACHRERESFHQLNT